jgi:hypothetical protein
MTMKKKEVKFGVIAEAVRGFMCSDGTLIRRGWWFGILAEPEKIDGVLAVKIVLQGPEKYVRLKDLRSNAKVIGHRRKQEEDDAG